MTLAYANVTPQAGLYRNGTIYQAKGRWYDGNLVRFSQDQVKPVGGWQLRSASAPAFAGACRATHAWRDNSNNRWIAVASHSHLYVQDESGTNHDITPAGYAVGRADATQNLGYGGGFYGKGAYGSPRASVSSYLPATVWSLDAWGDNLIGCADSDGKIYRWALNTASPAAVVSGAPTNCAALTVTQEGFAFALGANGDGRRVQWCDQQNITQWTAGPTNQAGDYDLTTSGTLQCGKAVPGGALLFTDVDVWQASYIGFPLVYGFQRVGSGCGVISKGAVVARDSLAAWMGKSGDFWLYDGQTVRPLDCDVRDYLTGLNQNQASKVTAVHLADQGEIWWFFPSAASNENDHYVAWCYRESERLGRNVWTFGVLGRASGQGANVFGPTPLMVDGAGQLWQHETGVNYGGASPYLETGPFQIGSGEYMAEVQQVVPDESANGDLTVTFFARYWPNGSDTTIGPIPLDSPTFCLFQARDIRCRFDFVNPSAMTSRLGQMNLGITRGDPAESAAMDEFFVLDFSRLDSTAVLGQ